MRHLGFPFHMWNSLWLCRKWKLSCKSLFPKYRACAICDPCSVLRRRKLCFILNTWNKFKSFSIAVSTGPWRAGSIRYESDKLEKIRSRIMLTWTFSNFRIHTTQKMTYWASTLYHFFTLQEHGLNGRLIWKPNRSTKSKNAWIILLKRNLQESFRYNFSCNLGDFTLSDMKLSSQLCKRPHLAS